MLKPVARTGTALLFIYGVSATASGAGVGDATNASRDGSGVGDRDRGRGRATSAQRSKALYKAKCSPSKFPRDARVLAQIEIPEPWRRLRVFTKAK